MPAATARILAVDDRPEVLRLVKRALARHYECDLVADVEEARSLLAGRNYELVLCDIQLPRESGLVLVEEIAGERPETAIVLVTGVDDPDVADRALELGAHGYLVKPFWPGQLLITAMTALRRRQLELAQRARTHTLEERLQSLMDMAPVPMFVKDRRRRYVVANRVTSEVAGLDHGEMLGRTDEAFMTAEEARLVRELDRVVLDEGRAVEAEEAFRVAGEERHFLTVKFPYVNDAGEIVGITGVAADVTAQHDAKRLHAALAAQQRRSIEELRSSRQETVDCLTRAIELHDATTGSHVNRMATLAAFLGELRGMGEEEALLLRSAAPMHDVGKVAVPGAILNKPGPLSAEERAEMERHTVVGHRILAAGRSGLLRLAARIALTHHERWDGRGYPHGLSETEIPPEGRIVALADVFDALLSDRPYRAAMKTEKALEIIEEGAGSHFDPELARLLLANAEEALALRG